jgi:hypothetical protein
LRPLSPWTTVPRSAFTPHLLVTRLQHLTTKPIPSIPADIFTHTNPYRHSRRCRLRPASCRLYKTHLLHHSSAQTLHEGKKKKSRSHAIILQLVVPYPDIPRRRPKRPPRAALAPTSPESSHSLLSSSGARSAQSVGTTDVTSRFTGHHTSQTPHPDINWQRTLLSEPCKFLLSHTQLATIDSSRSKHPPQPFSHLNHPTPFLFPPK